MIDLRSDTVTRPTKAMYEAMANAPLGDDVFEEDPTVRLLEEEAAQELGKEAALFVPTGTAGNLIAIMQHCSTVFSPEVIVGDRQHTYLYEGGNMGRLANVSTWVLPNEADGTLDLAKVEAAVRSEDVHHPRSRLLLLENTHNACGGVPLPTSYMDQAGALARQHGLGLHVDGARIFNAATALGEPVARVCRAADSVSFCLSKGLASPAGGVLVGQREFIRQARSVRKALGGGMRQVGILAACGLVSLRMMTKRLNEDHEAAQLLATGLSEMPGISVDPSAVKTNILFFNVQDNKANQLVQTLREDHGVLVGAYSTERVRMVTHNDLPRDKIPVVLDAFRASLASVLSDV